MVPREFGARPPTTLPRIWSVLILRLLERETAGRSDGVLHEATPTPLPCDVRSEKAGQSKGAPRDTDLHLPPVSNTNSRRSETTKRSMVHGTLEVLLVGAKGLENTDYLCNMDPYAILKCRSQEQRSSIASGKGSNPEWNESFVFTVTDRATDLIIKLMDSDSGTTDDFIGEATIPLEAVYTEGSIPPTAYNVVKGEHYCGAIKVGLTFTPEDVRQRGLPEDFGGWKQSH